MVDSLGNELHSAVFREAVSPTKNSDWQVWLKLTSVTVRFVDEEDDTVTKVLAAELSDVIGELRLSPRHHRLATSLTVTDLALHYELLSTAGLSSVYK